MGNGDRKLTVVNSFSGKREKVIPKRRLGFRDNPKSDLKITYSLIGSHFLGF